MAEMKERVTAKTEKIAVIGSPIKHSKSPMIHNESFNKLGLDYIDVAFEADKDNIEDVVKAFKALDFKGWNITMPVKNDMMKLCDHLTPAAEMCEAVNTVLNENGVLTGTSTDGVGYMGAMKDCGIDPIGKKITLIGVGGAATAIFVQAALDGVKEIAIFNRKDRFWDAAVAKVAEVNSKTDCKLTLTDLEDHDALRKAIDESYMLINATGVGMGKLEGLMAIPDASYLREDLIVSDLIYVPRLTKLLQTAKEVGCKTVVNGEGMLLFQAAASFKMWTGEDMPVDYLKEVLNIDPIV